jgi:NDP-sugar pyrophosphorylase family protein
MKPQILIPMSGSGERFRRAGYRLPKPLIPVDGKPIIAHVADLFPGEADFTFVCSEAHLVDPTLDLRRKLLAIRPKARIVPIAPHKLGPVHAALHAMPLLDPDRPTIINYCDFTNVWDWQDVLAFWRETDADGIMPCYRGFHPHSLGSTFYAYVKTDGLWALDIQEKQPWTDRPIDEFASTGTYGFRSARLAQEALEACVAQGLSTNGEFYVSLAYRPFLRTGRQVAVYEVPHFMQWGAPADLEAWQDQADGFRAALQPRGVSRPEGLVVLPAAGLGQRFADAGYATPKPLLEVSGRPMILQALDDLPPGEETRVVLRRDMPGAAEIAAALPAGATPVWLDSPTDGQARTVALALKPGDAERRLTIGACDGGLVYDRAALDAAMAGTDLLVWVKVGHTPALANPRAYGWIVGGTDTAPLRAVVKADPADRRAGVIVSAFTFRRAADFSRCFDRLVARDGRVRGEFYADSLVEDALALGLRVRTFPVLAWLCWGTPAEYETFRYWQRGLDLWPHHPYALRHDPRAAWPGREAAAPRLAPAPRPLAASIGAPVMAKDTNA